MAAHILPANDAPGLAVEAEPREAEDGVAYAGDTI